MVFHEKTKHITLEEVIKRIKRGFFNRDLRDFRKQRFELSESDKGFYTIKVSIYKEKKAGALLFRLYNKETSFSISY